MRQPVWVYAIVSPLTNKLKIGVSGDVGQRLDQLQRGGPDGDLYLLRFFRGAEEEEYEIQEHLRELGLHDHHEWFLYPPEVRQDIETYLDEFMKRIGKESDHD